MLPTQAMIDEHEATGHAVFRAWCAHCKEAWGVGRRHLAVDHGEDELPVVCSDFYFMITVPLVKVVYKDRPGNEVFTRYENNPARNITKV